MSRSLRRRGDKQPTGRGRKMAVRYGKKQAPQNISSDDDAMNHGKKKKRVTRKLFDFHLFFFFLFLSDYFQEARVCVHSLCTHACGSMKRRFDDGAVRGKLIRNETKQKYGHQKRITHKYTHTHYRAHLPPPSFSLSLSASSCPLRPSAETIK